MVSVALNPEAAEGQQNADAAGSTWTLDTAFSPGAATGEVGRRPVVIFMG